jgi:hypothetical protein
VIPIFVSNTRRIQLSGLQLRLTVCQQKLSAFKLGLAKPSQGITIIWRLLHMAGHTLQILTAEFQVLALDLQSLAGTFIGLSLVFQHKFGSGRRLILTVGKPVHQ